MAIEAITQMNTDPAVPEEITGYTLRNIAISVALVVSNDNDGVETLFSLRPATRKSFMAEDGLSNNWYDFTVSSNSYRTWKELGKGTIGINKRSRGEYPRLHRYSGIIGVNHYFARSSSGDATESNSPC